jgi:hypothetical protein
MRIDAVDFFYLTLPVVRDIGDGSQDALLVRVQAGDQVGWGEGEASPLVCLASWNCPMSHSACKPVSASVSPEARPPADISRIHEAVGRATRPRRPTTLSGIDVALWTCCRHLAAGFARPRAPIPRSPTHPLFGDDPQAAFRAARAVAGRLPRQVRLGPHGRSGRGVTPTRSAPREGLGARPTCSSMPAPSGATMSTPRQPACLRSRRRACYGSSLSLRRPTLPPPAKRSARVKLAGEVANLQQAQNMIDYAGLGFADDTGRIGGITTARRVADHAAPRRSVRKPHFTTTLALSASISRTPARSRGSAFFRRRPRWRVSSPPEA